MSSLIKILSFVKNEETPEYYEDVFSFANHNVNEKWFDSELLIKISNAVYSEGKYIFVENDNTYKFETIIVKGGFPNGNN